MKLRARPIEKRIWKRVKRELRASKELRKEYRRTKKRRVTSAISGWIWFVFLLFAALSSLPELVEQTGTLLVLMNAFTAAIACGICSFLIERLSTSDDVYVLVHFPVADDGFFRWQLGRTARATAWAPALAALPYVWLGVVSGFAADQWLVTAALLVLLWVTVIGVAVSGARYFPKFPFGLLAAGFGIPAFIGAILFSSNQWRLDWAGPWLLPLPTSWVHQAFMEGMVKNRPVALFWAVAPLAFIPIAWSALRFIRGSFRLGEQMFSVWGTAEQVRDEWVEMVREEDMEHFEQVTVEMLEPPDWRRGFIERTVDRWLTTREAALMNVMTAGYVDWTRRWRTAVILWVIAMVGIAITHYTDYGWFAVFAFALGALFALPVLGGHWNGLSFVRRDMMQESVIASFPVGYWELTRMIFKVSLVRLAFWLPLGVSWMALVVHNEDIPTVETTKVAAIALYCVVIAQFFFVGARFFDKTTARARATLSGSLFGVIGFIGLGTVPGGVFLMATGEHWALIIVGMLVALLIPFLAWLQCGYIYDKARTDLLVPVTQ